MKSLLKKGLLIGACMGLLWGGISLIPAYAQNATENLATVGDASGLGSEDIKIVVANFIRTALTFLGVIALCIVLYGGFVWMTAAGDPEKVDRAKRILINGGVGLVIILMSWSITTFVITSILGATGATGGSGSGEGGSAGGGGLGGGSSSSFEVTGISPEGTQTIRNIQVQVVFSHAVLDTSVNGAITVTTTETGEEVAGTIAVSGRRATFTPAAPCPSPDEDRFCFDENTQYTITVSDEIESTSGVALTCTTESCSGAFTSGTLVDTEDPTARMTAPDDHDAIAADDFERAEVQASDDVGIATADFLVDGGASFASVVAEGEDVSDVVLEAIWDTAGLTVGETYEVAVVVSDIAGNTDEDAVTVTARSSACFNGVQDSAETGVDCGGDSSSAAYCGSCEGSSCTESATCGGSSSCEDGVCSDLPLISGISPDNGAVGSYVTISGSGFGNSEGWVYFTGEDGGAVQAATAACADEWNDEEIVVVVPEGAIDGPISVMTSGGDVDTTSDEEGELVPDFDVNDIERPSLCTISPSSGMSASAVALTGSGFGASRNGAQVLFTNEEAGSYTSWADSAISATVPSLQSGEYAVAVRVDDIESNTLTFSVTEEEAGEGPTIVSISPSEGGPGQYVTITGMSFGSVLGSVWFKNEETGVRTLGDIDFPDACSQDIWSDTEVIVMVPNVEAGRYLVSIASRTGESTPVTFEVTTEDPTPGLCSISPESGEEGDTITLYGDNFGTSEGSVQFATALTGTIATWSGDEITVTVPVAAETGDVRVVNSAGSESNARTFTVGSGDSSASSTVAAAYAWSFSSGEIPEVPELIVACSDTTISAVPNDRFTEAACVNARVYAEFTTAMNEATLDDALRVEKCTASGEDPCASTTAVQGSYTTRPTSVTFSPVASFSPSSTYQVTVSQAAMSADGSALAQDESWTFTTKSDTSGCAVESVIVSPSSATLTAQYETQEFSAMPVVDCTVLDSREYTWGWSVDERYAGLTEGSEDCAGGVSACATVEALAEGSATVSATEQVSNKEGTGILTVNFSDPYVTQYFPNCTEACVNATVGASFNVPMQESSVLSGVSLYACANELCSTLTEVTSASASCTMDEEGSCRGFTFTLENTLSPGAYYRVVISGDVVSESGVPLIRTNYGEHFSWVFRVREDGSACAIERTAITPLAAQSSETGDRKVFTASAYGEADSCSVSGQLLDAYAYAWSWTDPIEDQNNDNNSATVVAAWNGSSFADTDPASLPEGCTASCTSAGSAAYAAVCGDGVLESSEGEECEDGNVANGDGCSSSCLREGAGNYGTCGNSVVERSEGGAGEDCDDGNTTNEDGCSSACLAEGSSAVGAKCGNNDIAYEATTRAGEECDDGNARNNDGCSSSCLNEGTPTLASIGGAICGDGTVDGPYESCDDGNVANDDGCSSQCLFEGASLSYAVPSVCGDGVQGTGEECEDGNDNSGDGCSADCVWEGSSASYAVPSYCGDGVVGTGEVATCEEGAGGDGRIDPVQAAYITNAAVFEVDSETGEATATIATTEASSSLTAEATWTLFCAATKDTDCTDPVTQGVGVGNCCMDRPAVDLVPADGTTNVCRNASLYGVFTQPMDLDTFTYTAESGERSYRMYAALNLSSVEGGVCPSTHTTLAQAPSGIFARMLRAMRGWIFGKDALATAGDCVLPISGYTQEAQSDGTYRVYVRTSELLAAGGEYSFIVEGDGDTTDGTVSGVRSEYGVGMYGNAANHAYAAMQTFSVSSEICAVDAVQVTDDSTENPGSFSSLADEHQLSAAAISYTGGAQEIAPIEGVYDWTWSSWETDNTAVLDVAQNGAGSATALVAPAGENGTGNVIASLTIENNTSGIETESEVSGYTEMTALLCENPWPSIEYYPWTDDAEGESVGAEEGIGWMNFSFGYCRDNGVSGTEDDLPGLTVIRPSDTQDDAILKEYLFQVQGSADAIGVRIAANSEYLSPAAWYAAQGFTGSPSETTIDGFPAVEDGRTTYIAAPNFSDSTNYLYSNMYIISYNGNASEEAQNIYDQIVSSILFGTNISSVGYCSTGSAYTTACSSDLDCNREAGEQCADNKQKIARDTMRLADMTDLRTDIERYGEENGFCSETTSQLCTQDGDCPGSETCEPGVPALSSGTAVRAFASSVWGSWDGIFAGALNTSIDSDPLNVYRGCGEDPYAAYDSDTCVDETRGQYLCPEGSYAYHYRAYGQESAYIFADLEYPNADWYYPIDEDGIADGVAITIGGSSGFIDGFEVAAFCDGETVYGGSSTCGDGLLGTGEVCEIGEQGGTSTACDSDGDGSDDGYMSQICNSSCTGFTEDTSATCTPTTCGNGIVENAEACDDGTANGRYGYCGNDCTYDTAMYCGDGVLSGGELCDCGDSDIFSSIPATGRAYGASSSGSCTAFNGVYTSSSSVSCAWDCSGPSAYCGDSEVTDSEECDGADETWSGALCLGGADAGNPCTEESDCRFGGVCGGSGAYAACATGYTRVLSCDDAEGASCTYTDSWRTTACTEIGSCGDGVVDPDEECDDGNTVGTDACTASCTNNVCGDGYLYSGEEECDEGSGNGSGCDASYGSTCSACTTSCRQTVSSGAFCGDGVINGSEVCDGSDIAYNYFDSETGDLGDACDASLAGTADSSGVYTCRRVGICNGGPDNGEYCTGSSSNTSVGNDLDRCGYSDGLTEVSCVFPSCADTCTSSCPFVEATTGLLMTPNLSGSLESSSVDLYSYSSSSTSSLPNAATITMPACTVAGTLTGTIDTSDIDLPDAYVVFVTDRSSSMSGSLGGSSTRMSVARDLLSTSVTSLFEGLGENMHISLVGYSYNAGTGICSASSTYSCNADDDCSGGAACENELVDMLPYGFGDVADESVLQSRISEFTQGGATYTDAAFAEAKEILDAVPDDGNVRKIVVLLSDGESAEDPIEESNALKDAGYEVYTVALTTTEDLITDMRTWSSNNGETQAENGIDYAYDGDTTAELQDAYQSIIDSILGVTISVVSSGDAGVEFTSGVVTSGSNISLPWPENFSCDPAAEQEIPLQVTFLGEGTINLSNLRIEYCAP